MPDLMACMISRHAVMIRETRAQLFNTRAMRRRTDWVPAKDRVVGRNASPGASKRAILGGILHTVLRRKRLLFLGAAAGVVVISQAMLGAFGSRVSGGAESPGGSDRYPATGGVLGQTGGQGLGSSAGGEEHFFPEGLPDVAQPEGGNI